MQVHLHTLRTAFAATLGIIVAIGLLRWAYPPPPADHEIVPVSGRATCGGQPLAGMVVVFEEAGPRDLIAFAKVQADGSFRVRPWGDDEVYGVGPGTYRVYFVGPGAAGSESRIDPKYENPRTTDLLVHVGPEWNDFTFTLPAAERGPI